MDISKVDKVALKSILREILIEEPTLLKAIIKEILVENEIIETSDQAKRRKKIEQLIDTNFDKYEEVFKALA